MPCGCSPCGNLCVCDIIRREIKVVGVGVVSEHQSLLLIITISTCVVPQFIGPCLCCCCCGVMHQEQHLHPTSHFLLSTTVPIKPLLLSPPPLSESGRHPLPRCGGVQAICLAWKSILIQGMRDMAESSHYCSTVCMLLWRDAPGAAPPPHITHHWQPQGGFITTAP